ncbi:MAG TPA: arylesterase [Pyrinomonadaceae bacterium]|nr:arylesterase [Pyrinomonadaceae bacterium]
MCIELSLAVRMLCTNMTYLLRVSGLTSFIFFVAIMAGCGQGDRFSAGSYDVERPLIEPDRTVSKPKIIAFGDSLTAGFGLSENESYPYLLQERLKADGYDFEVINAGVSGDTSLGGLERADWVLDQDAAKVLILALGANDLLRGMPVDRMKKNLAEIISKAKKRDMKVLLCGMLAPPTMGNAYQRDYNNAFADLADEFGTAFLPFMLEGVAMEKELNQADGIHPNAEGTRQMVENIYKELKPILESR